MANIQAFLDDFGSIRVIVNRNFFNGNTGGFYLATEDGQCHDCVVRNVEDHEREKVYDLTIPTDLSFGKNLILYDNHGQSVPVVTRYITQTEEFDRQFDYDGDDLGCLYSEDHTDFALWAPTAVSVILRIRDDHDHISLLSMNRTARGVWRARAQGNLKHATYVYLIERDGQIVETTDPYALSSTANGRESAVIDLSEIMKIPDPGAGWTLRVPTDAIIYECSIRDMTSSVQTGTSTHGKFISLTQRHTSWKGMPTGLDYLRSLGVTHVQIQPVNDFQTVDEGRPERSYNWGYDPSQLLVLEGSYATDAKNPYTRMTEFRRMIAALHTAGLKVNTDVVFNHMYDAKGCSLDKTVPYYYFRFSNGYYSNGSGCGNDLESRRPMLRKYFMHVVRTWMQVYGVDGFRFDLMGILDVDTMNAIAAAARGIKKDAMIYGEGWDMPTAMDGKFKAKIYNQHHMPSIAHFNDTFRDTAKGRTSDDCRYDKGYLTGNLGMAFDMCSCLSGNSMGEPYFRRFDSPSQSVNNVETHDNSTAWDKMHACCADEPREIRMKRMKMLNCSVLLAQGIPFLHAGQEFCGTKQDNSNSYNAGDVINQMNWDRMILNMEVLDYTKKAIQLRRRYQQFRFCSASQLDQYVRFSVVDGCVVFYDINYPDTMHGCSQIRVIINPSLDYRYYQFDGEWNVLFDENGNSHDEVTSQFSVPQCTMIVLKRKS